MLETSEDSRAKKLLSESNTIVVAAVAVAVAVELVWVWPIEPNVNEIRQDHVNSAQKAKLPNAGPSTLGEVLRSGA